MTETTTSPVRTTSETVLEYHSAWTTNRIDEAMALVSDDIVCHAPGGDLVGKPVYREFIAGFAPRLTGTTDLARFDDGDRFALLYYPETAVTTTTLCAEYFSVQDGLIVETWLAFDRLSYGPPSA